MVVQVLVVVHPDLCGPHAVGQRLAPRVGGLLGEDVAHVGAGVDLQRASTLPDLPGQARGTKANTDPETTRTALATRTDLIKGRYNEGACAGALWERMH